MNQPASPHSFRQLLDRKNEAYTQYVLSDFRHAGMIEFLGRQISNFADSDVLDIGCGAGVISRGLAHACKSVTGIDGNADNIAMAKSYAQGDDLDNAHFECAWATELPSKDQSMDVVLLNGVLEWVGANDEGEDPRARQLRVLKEACRVLKAGGALYVGIENRWHPATLIRDPHSGLPLVNALPRKLADIIAQRKHGKPFQTYIYGHVDLAKLINEAGFGKIEKFVPFPGYQFPAAFVRPFPRSEALADIDAIDRAHVQRVMSDSGRHDNIDYSLKRIRQKASAGLLGLFAHDLSFVATKN